MNNDQKVHNEKSFPCKSSAISFIQSLLFIEEKKENEMFRFKSDN